MSDDGFQEVHVELGGGNSRAISEGSGSSFPTVSIPGSTTSADNYTRESEYYKGANLAVAKMHFEMMLPKRVIDKHQPSGYRRALPGETRSAGGEACEFYKVTEADELQMNEFGIGVSLYFKTLKLLFIVMFLCAFISLVAIQRNTKHTPDDAGDYLIGSAYGATRDDLKFQYQGASDIAVTFILVLLFLCAGTIQKYSSDAIDEAILTSNDYSVCVVNPPEQYAKADDYYDYFSRFGDVVLITVAKNNGELIRELGLKKSLEERLVAQKSYKHKAEEEGQEYVDQDKIGCLQSFIQSTMGYLPTLGLVTQQLEECKNKIESLKHSDFKPWRVYCTYANEVDADKCLSETAISLWEKWFGVHIESPAHFRDKALFIARAHEPNDVSYENSDYAWKEIWIRLVISYLSVSAMMVVVFFIVDAMAADGGSGAGVALFISIINSIIPEVVKYVTLTVEVHHNKSDRQKSSLLKLMVVRCVNSAVLIYLATPYKEKFSAEALEHIMSILIADAISTPFFRLLDIGGLFRRHVLTKYVVTQEEMNVLWMPSEWSLAERYTDMMKTLFVGLYYSVPLPAGLFITCFSMASTYLVDKYSLFKLWKEAPNFDSTLATTSRYLLAFVIYAHATMSQRFFANWPYGDAEKAECTFFICYTSDEMTNSQKKIVYFYNGLNITLFVFAVGYLFVTSVATCLFALFSKITDADEGDLEGAHENTKNFRQLSAVSGYVPMIEMEDLADPLIAADVDKIPEQYSPITNFTEFGKDSQQKALHEHSVATSEELGGCDADALVTLFADVKHYESKAHQFQSYGQGYINKRQSAVPKGSSTNNSTTTNAPSPAQATTTYNEVRVGAVVPPIESITGGDKDELPPGWKKAIDPSTGKVYYKNKTLKTTQWEKPTA